MRPAGPLPIDSQRSPGWVIDLGRRSYGETLRWQRSLVPLRRRGMIRDMLIFVEHDPVVTLGKQTHEDNLLAIPAEIPTYEIERGGDVTYHGPGQSVCYLVFDLSQRGRDLHAFMRSLEQGIIDTLSEYDVTGKRIVDYTGVWVDTEHGERKIASIGVAAKQWVSFHGVAVNLNTDMSMFESINPCGLQAEVMTSLESLTGKEVSLSEFTARLAESYARVFALDLQRVTLNEISEDIESNEGGGHV